MSNGSREPVEVGSNAVYDHTCQICADRGEKEAVRFCMSCDMYMCQTCCDLHKKIPLAINHKVLEKEKFGEIHTVKRLFEKRLIPTLTTQCPAQLDNHSVSEILHVLDIPNSENILCCLEEKTPGTYHRYEIGIIDYTNGYCRQCREIVYKHSKSQEKNWCTCDNMYMTLTTTNKLLKYCYKHRKSDIAFVLPAGNKCYGITQFRNRLAIAVNIDTEYDLPNWKIQLVQLDGMPITEFYYDDNGRPLFNNSRILAANSLQTVLFVATEQGAMTSKYSVLALDTNGTLLFKYAAPVCGILYGITCDIYNNVYFWTGGKVIQTDQNGNKSRDLLKSNKGINFVAICFNTKLQQFVVADSNHKITFFKFV